MRHDRSWLPRSPRGASWRTAAGDGGLQCVPALSFAAMRPQRGSSPEIHRRWRPWRVGLRPDRILQEVLFPVAGRLPIRSDSVALGASPFRCARLNLLVLRCRPRSRPRPRRRPRSFSWIRRERGRGPFASLTEDEDDEIHPSAGGNENGTRRKSPKRGCARFRLRKGLTARWKHP